jgi:hypothetical protein
MDEYTQSYMRVMKMAGLRAPHNTYLICDLSGLERNPARQSRLASRVLFLTKHFQHNLKLIMLVDADPFSEYLLNAISPMIPHIRRRVRLVDTVAEAEYFIDVARAALGDLPPYNPAERAAASPV